MVHAESCVGLFRECLNVRSESLSRNSVAVITEHKNCKTSRERNIRAILSYSSREKEEIENVLHVWLYVYVSNVYVYVSNVYVYVVEIEVINGES